MGKIIHIDGPSYVATFDFGRVTPFLSVDLRAGVGMHHLAWAEGNICRTLQEQSWFVHGIWLPWLQL